MAKKRKGKERKEKVNKKQAKGKSVVGVRKKDYDKKSIQKTSEISKRNEKVLHVVNKFMISCWNIIINRRGDPAIETPREKSDERRYVTRPKNVQT